MSFQYSSISSHKRYLENLQNKVSHFKIPLFLTTSDIYLQISMSFQYPSVRNNKPYLKEFTKIYCSSKYTTDVVPKPHLANLQNKVFYFTISLFVNKTDIVNLQKCFLSQFATNSQNKVCHFNSS